VLGSGLADKLASPRGYGLHAPAKPTTEAEPSCGLVDDALRAPAATVDNV